jgi:hypothetical protein
MRNKVGWLRAALVAMVCLALASHALADAATVIGYTQYGGISDAYKPGQKLSSDTVVELAYCHSTLILRTERGFVELHGPYNGTLSAYKGPNCASAAWGERVSVYDNYFHATCEKKGTCDTICSEVFRRVTHKNDMKIKCP